MPDKNSVKISEDVIAVVASVAATEVKGVAGLCSGSIVGGLMKSITKSSASKGVKATIGENSVIIDLHIIIEYGYNISETAEAVQLNVRNEVETMTGMDNIIVNVNVDEIAIKEEPKQEKNNNEKIKKEDNKTNLKQNANND